MYSVNWVGVLCNVGIGVFLEWGGGGGRGEMVFFFRYYYIVYGRTEKLPCGLNQIGMWYEWLETK